MNSTALRAEKLKNIGTVPVPHEVEKRLRGTKNTSLIIKGEENENTFKRNRGWEGKNA